VTFFDAAWSHAETGAGRLIRPGSYAWCAVLALSGIACNDAVLDLGERAASERVTGTAGAGGTAGQGNEAGASGDDGVGGARPNALHATDFCEGGVGECFYRGGTLDCTGDVGQSGLTQLREDRARIAVDMTRAAELRVAFEICDPAGYVFDIGDSSSNNGGGGDWGHFEHDAEVLIYDTDLTAFSSDLGYEQESPDTGYHPLLLSRPDYLSARGCSVRSLHVRDQYIADADDPTLRTQSPVALRIHPSTDAQGYPDAQWHIGVNRVVSSMPDDRDRVGSGVTTLRLCFTMPPPQESPRAGP
jgi:hypothetical protein